MNRELPEIQAPPELRPQSGFTLIELLVVIVILGIVSAVAVFSVSGVGRGESASCKVDARTLDAAQAAAFAQTRETGGTGRYTDEDGLLAGDFLTEPSPLHDIVLSDGGVAVADTPGVDTGDEYFIILSPGDKQEQCIPTRANLDATSVAVQEAECTLPEDFSAAYPDEVATPLATSDFALIRICKNATDGDDRYPY
ncbi:MAG: type II secretion system protein [Acidimicrobiales bacterium]